MGLVAGKTKTPVKEVPSIPTLPHGKLMYGENDRACSVLFGNLDADLHKYIVDNTPAFSCPESGMISLGFAKCIDYPFLPQHVYYEGYFHSCKDSEPIESLNPRNGRAFKKPPAPKALRALYVAFREKNKDILQEMMQRILELPEPKPLEVEGGEKKEKEEQEDKEIMDDRKILANMFDPDGELVICSDLAIQVHCGTTVIYEQIGWHRDTVNSMFHFAASIKGKRDLYSKLRERPDEPKSTVYIDRLEAPNIYISSPTFFEHAVGYPEVSWEDRTIAIQARFLLTRDLLNSIARMSNELKVQLSHVIAEYLVTGFELPSLQEVKEVEATLKDYDGSLKVDDNYMDGLKGHDMY